MQPTLAQPHAAPTERDALIPLLLATLLAGTIVFLWFAASAEEIYMALHVTAAVVWVGGGTALTIFALLTQRTHDPHALANLIHQIEWISRRVFTPSALVTLGFGIALAAKMDSGSPFWIDFGLVIWALSFVLGLAVIGPRTAKLKRLIGERGLEDAVVQRGIAQVLRFARIDVTMLLLVVVDMAAKPSF